MNHNCIDGVCSLEHLENIWMSFFFWILIQKQRYKNKTYELVDRVTNIDYSSWTTLLWEKMYVLEFQHDFSVTILPLKLNCWTADGLNKFLNSYTKILLGLMES